MKKQLIIAALLLALAVLAFMFLYTVTVYPAFQKSVGSIDTLRQALRSDAILYPAVEDLLQEPNCNPRRSSRPNCAPHWPRMRRTRSYRSASR